MVDGNIVDCSMHGYVQDKQKETCIGSIIILIFTTLMLLPFILATHATSSNNRKIVFDEIIDISHNYSLIFVPKAWPSDKWIRRTTS